MRLTTIIATLAGLTLALGAGTATTAGASSAAETCFGLVPTIVAPPGADLVTGTAGDDVIVADGAGRVEAGEGDDVVCATAVRWITAGTGDDRVSHQQAPRGHVVVLGPGSDVFEGSDVRDRVMAEDFDGEGPVAGAGADNTDVVHTYGGNDRVVTGDRSQVNHDVVDTGAGPDSIELEGAADGAAVIGAGSGTDELSVRVQGVARLDVDLSDGTVQIDRAAIARVAGVEDVLADAFRGSAHVRGTSGRNGLSVTARDARVSAGAGPDRVRVFGCGSVARGGAGADVLVSTYQGCRRDPVTLYGGAGDDRLHGSRAADVLVGNGGRDRAAGGRGRDVCRAEVERSCERG